MDSDRTTDGLNPRCIGCIGIQRCASWVDMKYAKGGRGPDTLRSSCRYAGNGAEGLIIDWKNALPRFILHAAKRSVRAGIQYPFPCQSEVVDPRPQQLFGNWVVRPFKTVVTIDSACRPKPQMASRISKHTFQALPREVGKLLPAPWL